MNQGFLDFISGCKGRSEICMPTQITFDIFSQRLQMQPSMQQMKIKHCNMNVHRNNIQCLVH